MDVRQQYEAACGRLRSGSARLARSVLYLACGFPVGLVWLVCCVVLLGLGLATALFLVGIPLIAAVLLSGIPLGVVERARLRMFTGTAVPSPHAPASGRSPRAWLRQRATEPATWWELAYAVAHCALSYCDFVLVTGSLTLSLALLAAPLLRRFTPDGQVHMAVFQAYSDTQALVLVLCGTVLLALTYLTLTRYAAARARLATCVLTKRHSAAGVDQDQDERIGHLVRSRARILDAYDAERRRIERDLHDGAQQRLTGLIMTLGLARLELAEGDSAARELVDKAAEEARTTLRELRELVHGIYPATLTDRGLSAALVELAEDAVLPVETDVALAERPPEAVEAATYFVACEAMANVTKHSAATEGRLSLRRTGTGLVLEVRDNGVGGADAESGTGLLGLADRVAVFGGTVHLSSPAGGPTLLHVEIPCGS
ncbi:sensor histidine kinase [Streptomyces tubercidicus]|uniref:histidine kinase n=1 Tax=Streptomyces tubercidicus TaxID=47759 RepID=A0A640URB4_9ACTN|nr:sensor histidine kinase [Streptomyces tubercidicus]WAU12727.1 sensor histidine kinase [Streptomyces tubercidicus]GFE38217.1 histidine kinase [Streptomyces tubercidicus]